jgi:hypothetical protein
MPPSARIGPCSSSAGGRARARAGAAFGLAHVHATAHQVLGLTIRRSIATTIRLRCANSMNLRSLRCFVLGFVSGFGLLSGRIPALSTWERVIIIVWGVGLLLFEIIMERRMLRWLPR